MPRTWLHLSPEKRELQDALLCWVDSCCEINTTRSVGRGKSFLWDQLRDGCCCAPFLSLFLNCWWKNGLNWIRWILGLCFSNTYFLQPTCCSQQWKKPSHHCFPSQHPKQNKLYFKSLALHCNCIYTKGSQQQNRTRQGWTCWWMQPSQSVVEMTL